MGSLGFQEIDKPEPLASRGGCWFQGHRTVVHLGVQDPHVPATKAHPAFLVRNLQVARARLTAAGVTVTPDDSLPDVRRFYAADPFGNRIEFLQQGDGFSERADRRQ